ncbi:MAG: TatD family hydrolase, partial [Patescibacteria group bacterium]
SIERGDFDANYYRNLAKNHKVAAIGECGLDYFHKNNKEKQKEIFKKQIELALELDKPLIIHCRQAHDDVLDILNSYRGSMLRGNIHFFSGDWEQAQKYFNLGFLISFTGVITFPPLRRAGTGDYDEIIKKAPLEKIMVETDAPFVTPVPYRGQRNEPFYVKEVAQKLAEVKGLSYEEVAKATTDNAVKLFNIK